MRRLSFLQIMNNNYYKVEGSGHASYSSSSSSSVAIKADQARDSYLSLPSSQSLLLFAVTIVDVLVTCFHNPPTHPVAVTVPSQSLGMPECLEKFLRNALPCKRKLSSHDWLHLRQYSSNLYYKDAAIWWSLYSYDLASLATALYSYLAPYIFLTTIFEQVATKEVCNSLVLGHDSYLEHFYNQRQVLLHPI